MSRHYPPDMEHAADPDLARLARVMGDPSRAAMLCALLGGEPLAAGELAKCAAIAPSTASGHLGVLTEAGLVSCRRAGRQRRYALANAAVASAIEALIRIAPLSSDGGTASAQLRHARSCYDHLAGRLGVMVTEAMCERGLVTGRDAFEITGSGEAWLEGLNVDVGTLRRGRRPLALRCLDWSERRDHLAGAAGAALLAVLFERRWIARRPGTRAVRLTLRGREGLYRVLGLEITALGERSGGPPSGGPGNPEENTRIG